MLENFFFSKETKICIHPESKHTKMSPEKEAEMSSIYFLLISHIFCKLMTIMVHLLSVWIRIDLTFSHHVARLIFILH